MITIDADDAKSRFAELMQKVEAGEEITITRGDVPIAKLVPAKRKSTVEERKAAIAAIRELSKGVTLGGLKIKDLVSEGRK